PVGPGLFPTITGAAMVIFGAVLAAQGWLAPAGGLISGSEEPAETVLDPTPRQQRGRLDAWFIPLLLLAVAASIPLMPVLGFLITGTIFTAVIVILCGGSL